MTDLVYDWMQRGGTDHSARQSDEKRLLAKIKSDLLSDESFVSELSAVIGAEAGIRTEHADDGDYPGLDDGGTDPDLDMDEDLMMAGLALFDS